MIVASSGILILVAELHIYSASRFSIPKLARDSFMLRLISSFSLFSAETKEVLEWHFFPEVFQVSSTSTS